MYKPYKKIRIFGPFRPEFRFFLLQYLFHSKILLYSLSQSFKYTKSTLSPEAYGIQVKFHENYCSRGYIHPIQPSIRPSIHTFVHLTCNFYKIFHIYTTTLYIHKHVSCFFILFSFRGIFVPSFLVRLLYENGCGRIKVFLAISRNYVLYHYKGQWGEWDSVFYLLYSFYGLP